MQLTIHKLLALPLLFILLVAAAPTPRPTNAKPPRSVTGHYVMRREEFRNRLDVQQLPDGKIKFDLVALWVSHHNPENVHNGEIQAITSLENGVAFYQSGDCKLKMEFFPNIVRIRHSGEGGDCGFGANVTAAGSYRKINSKKPKFDF